MLAGLMWYIIQCKTSVTFECKSTGTLLEATLFSFFSLYPPLAGGRFCTGTLSELASREREDTVLATVARTPEEVRRLFVTSSGRFGRELDDLALQEIDQTVTAQISFGVVALPFTVPPPSGIPPMDVALSCSSRPKLVAQ